MSARPDENSEQRRSAKPIALTNGRWRGGCARMSRNFQGQIRSNTIAPTFIETPLTHPVFEDAQFKASVLAKIKLGRIGQVKDILGAIIYLASDAAASSLAPASLSTAAGPQTEMMSAAHKPRFLTVALLSRSTTAQQNRQARGMTWSTGMKQHEFESLSGILIRTPHPTPQ